MTTAPEAVPVKHVVVGTAGHIDHGKTELVRALTGINTDRFKEEQERGITIDIGFAPLSLGPDLTVGFVDVPGHEKFVKNMLAGVWGIDLVLLVVAADESVKPQTREHFDICSLLRVKRGLIAVTKTDLVEPDLIDLVTLEVREFVHGSFLQDAPVVPVSAKTREGLERLKAALAEAARRTEPGRASSLLRMPVDRSFSVRGFGTVVTGTLISGRMAEGDEVAIFPEGRRCRVRGIQVYNRPVAEASAGRRTAVNLQGVEAGAVGRGQVLAGPDELLPSSLLDVKVFLLPGAPRPLKDLHRVRFHQGTSELFARVKLLGASEIAPGREAYAQLRMERPACCTPGDRFVLRRYSPTTTIGGGVVLDIHPRKHRGRAGPDLLQRLAILDRDGGGVESLKVWIEEETTGIRLPDLALRAGQTIGEVETRLEKILRDERVLRAGEGRASLLIGQHRVESFEAGVLDGLDSYHRANPLRRGMPREELKARVFGAGGGGDLTRLVLERLTRGGKIDIQRDVIRLRSHHVALSAEDEGRRQALEETFRRRGLNPPTLEEAARENRLEPGRAEKLLHLLLSDGRLVRIRDGKVFHAEAIEGLKSKLWEMLPSCRVIDIGSFKQLTGTSRKNAIPLLEHLDAVHVTRRVGSDREILPPARG
ncbi:MAG: selenocysteine-specific translation elongation factor [Acidobacteriota bacterium]